MDKIIKIIGAIVVAGLALSAVYLIAGTMGESSPSAALAPRSAGPVFFFYGQECPHCHAVMPFIENLSKKYPEADIRVLEIWHNQTNRQTYNAVLKSLNQAPGGVPAVVIGDTVLVGDVDIPAKLEGLIRQRLGR